MGLRFRQSFTLFPGVRLNMGKRGFSASFGAPGATVNVSRRGVRATVGIPGSGISYTQDLYKFGQGNDGNQYHNPRPQMRYISPEHVQYYAPQDEGQRLIRSAAVEYLTSDGLKSLRDLIITANTQQKEIRADLAEARAEEIRQRDKLLARQKSLFRYFYKRSIAELSASLPVVAAEVLRLEEWEQNTKIKIEFDAGEHCNYVYSQLVEAFDDLRKSSRIWDITSESDVDQFRERSNASRSLYRKLVRFDYVSNDLIEFDGKAMRFQNANGNDILIYPGVALIPSDNGDFALIDLRELNICGGVTRFIESEGVPHDSEIVDHTWFKVNKNGSPDRRFNDNYQIPICKYGELVFSSGKGINEQYHLSQAKPANFFGALYPMYQEALQQASDRAESAPGSASRIEDYRNRKSN